MNVTLRHRNAAVTSDALHGESVHNSGRLELIQSATRTARTSPAGPGGVERRGKGSGRVRMAVIPDFKEATIIPFLTRNVEPGSTIHTDGLMSFAGLTEALYKRVARTQPLRSDLRKGAKSAVPLADRAIGNLQQWLIGTFHGVSRAPTPGLPRRIRLST